MDHPPNAKLAHGVGAMLQRLQSLCQLDTAESLPTTAVFSESQQRICENSRGPLRKSLTVGQNPDKIAW